MWTPEQNKQYTENMRKGKHDAIALGNRLSKLIKSKIKKERKDQPHDAQGIDSIYFPLMLEPIISSLDYAYEPGFVLEYHCESPDIEKLREVDNKKCENAWMNLEKINRFLHLINPFCTALDINIYNKILE